MKNYRKASKYRSPYMGRVMFPSTQLKPSSVPDDNDIAVTEEYLKMNGVIFDQVFHDTMGVAARDKARKLASWDLIAGIVFVMNLQIKLARTEVLEDATEVAYFCTDEGWPVLKTTNLGGDYKLYVINNSADGLAVNNWTEVAVSNTSKYIINKLKPNEKSGPRTVNAYAALQDAIVNTRTRLSLAVSSLLGKYVAEVTPGVRPNFTGTFSNEAMLWMAQIGLGQRQLADLPAKYKQEVDDMMARQQDYENKHAAFVKELSEIYDRPKWFMCAVHDYGMMIVKCKPSVLVQVAQEHAEKSHHTAPTQEDLGIIEPFRLIKSINKLPHELTSSLLTAKMNRQSDAPQTTVFNSQDMLVYLPSAGQTYFQNLIAAATWKHGNAMWYMVDV